jgi:hypothetical protein
MKRSSESPSAVLRCCTIVDLNQLADDMAPRGPRFMAGVYRPWVGLVHEMLDGKAVISAELSGILERLGSSAERWRARLEKLKSGRLLGRFFAASRARLREVAAALGVHHLANLGGCPAR